MTGTVWVPGAQRLTPAGEPGTMLGDAPARSVWHTTEAPSGGKYFDLMARVLVRKKFEPHLLYDPLTDRLGQFFPLDHSARALQNDDTNGIHTNRTGTACIQIEVVAQAAKPFTSYWQPGPNFRALMAAIRSWGIPDEWPFGALSKNGEPVSRDVEIWKGRGGHCAHANIPGNVHWDCGDIDQAALFTAAPIELEDDLQADEREWLREAHDRVMGILRQRYWVVRDGQQVEVPAGTPGATACSILDSLDGAYLLAHGGDKATTAIVTELRAQVAALTSAIGAVAAGAGVDAAAVTAAAKSGAAAALSELHLAPVKGI